MNQDDIIRMAREAGAMFDHMTWVERDLAPVFERFAALVAVAEREACAKIVETYRIPVGNSVAGEMACKWTHDALKEILDAIRARGQE